MKKIISILITIALAICGTVISASCQATPKTEIDESKTQLYVGNYNGGVGDKWLYEVKDRFEEKYSDYKLGDKVGVQIIIDSDKDCIGTSLISTIKADPNEVYFTQQMNYYDYVAQGLVKDITGLIKKSNQDDGNKTIFDKLYDTEKNTLKVNDKYYAIPHYELYDGLTYDAYMFENSKLYFSTETDTDGTRKFITNANPQKSCGPDGVSGTYDDGLPSSFQEFNKLINKMITSGAGYPFIWAGEQTHYTKMLIMGLYYNYIGAEGLNININFDSNGKEIETIKSFSNGIPNLEKVVISAANDNQYLVKNAAGLYYALEFTEQMFRNSDAYDPESKNPSFSFTTAQETFLQRGLDGKKRIGMLIEGSYWYNEAIGYGTVERISTQYSQTFSTKKDPKFMPLPQKYTGTVEEGEGGSPVMVDSYNAFAFINNNIKEEKVDLAEQFLSFCYTDAELINFTKATNGTLRGVNYDYQSIIGDLNGFGKSVVEMRNAAKVGNSFVKGLSNNSIFTASFDSWRLDIASKYLDSKIGNKSYNYLWTAVNQDNYSARDYFEGMWITKSEWDSTYKK